MDAHKKTTEREGEGVRGAIVGIGGSVREADDLRRFFGSVAPGCGVAFVIVLNEEPGFAEDVVSALAPTCCLPVIRLPTTDPPADSTSPAPALETASDCACEPDRVYVVPSRALPTIEAGRLRVGEPNDARVRRAPIDRFLVSLAEDQEDNAACIVLSGTGGDGTVGVRAIKLHGGLVLAQSDAGNGGSMRASPAAALADLAIPIEEIASRLQEHFDHRTALLKEHAFPRLRADLASRLTDFCDILRLRTGHDFSGFKGGAIVRQAQRRMLLRRMSDADAFMSLLKADPSEADRLFNDLSIGLTEFFHSRTAFERLEREVIPQILAGRGAGDVVRVWVPACGTGEEAYAVAMLLLEQVGDGAGPNIQVFASDIDDRNLASARSGRYPHSIEEFVSGERLRRFFVREQGTWRVAGALRDRCLFTSHDLLRDPPFARIDLLVCRNLLIHLETGLQRQVVSVLHYAMREGGYLFLGESENVADSALFETIDPAYRIFRKRPGERLRLPKFPISARAPARRAIAAGAGSPVERAELDEPFGPAYAIIDAAGGIIRVSGRSGRYFEQEAGARENDIFSLARPDLRPELEAALREAVAGKRAAGPRQVRVRSNGGRTVVTLIVMPFDAGERRKPAYLVVFVAAGEASDGGAPGSGNTGSGGNARIRRLELELRELRERLQTTAEELESSNEELRSANEEMSSLNEELQTVNAELNVRIDELSSAMNDVANLLESTRIATIFLDRDLRLRFFTPAACDLYHVVAGDLGRPISDLQPRFHCESLYMEAKEVQRTLIPCERPVSSTESNRIYLMRILPYRTVSDEIDGVVLTFVEQKPFNLPQ